MGFVTVINCLLTHFLFHIYRRFAF